MRTWSIFRATYTLAVVSLAACSGAAGPDSKPVPVDAIDVEPAAVTMVRLEERLLTATPKAKGQPLTGRLVLWNTSDPSTATITAQGVVRAVRAGNATITAISEGKTGTAAITVINPAPTLTSISPTNAIAGSAAFTLTVTGSSFLGSSDILWNGALRATTFVSSTQLTTVISAADIANGGVASVTVVTGGPGGGTSPAVPFTITAPNPAPTITTISPTSALVGSPTFTLNVNGTGFIDGSTVRWNGTARTTTFVSATRLTASIPAADLITAGTAQVSVFTATPGGGTSANSAFTISALGPLVLSTHQLNSAKFNDTLALTVTRDGRTLTPAFSLRTERRWLFESPVLSTVAFNTSRIVTAGVGRAVVNVVAEGLTDSVVVDVALLKPLITAITGPAGRTHLGAGDTIHVRGYGMHQVTIAQLFAPSLGVVAAANSDSATIRVVTTIDPGASCTGRPAIYKLTQSAAYDAAVSLTTSYTRARTGELNLAVGAAQAISGGNATCIRLAPAAPNARYLLAFFDTRRMKQSEGQFEAPAPVDVTVRVEDKTGAAPALRNVTQRDAQFLSQSAATSSAHLTSSGTSAERASANRATSALVDVPFAACGSMPTAADWAVYCRATPWTVGATFNYKPIVTARAAGPAHIIAVSPNVVAAVFDADQAFVAPAALVRIQATIDYMSTTYMTLLQQSFKTTRKVVTSPGSNQLVVMFESGNSTNNPRVPGDGVAPSGTWAMVSMIASATNCYGNPAGCPNFSGVDEIVIHETAHTFQFLWNKETRAGVQPFSQSWGVEGDASLHEMLVSLDRNSVAWDANTSFESFPLGDIRRSLTPYANGSLSLFTLGYRTSAAFYRYLIQHLVKDKGMTYNDAFYEVQIGAIEGWYGVGFGGVSLGQGLVPRMRARFGVSWDPVQAMLEWTMTDAADDLTANPLFQNLTQRISARETPAGVYVHNGFKPYASIAAGASTFGETTLASGNTGVFQLEDPNVGASFAATSIASGNQINSQVSWLILRVR